MIQPDRLFGEPLKMTREAAERLLISALSSPGQSYLPVPCRQLWWKLYAWSVHCTVPLYSQCRGNPLCAYFQFTFQNGIGNETDFQLWFIEHETTGPGTVLGSRTPLSQMCVSEEAPTGEHAPVSKECASELTYVSHCLCIKKAYTCTQTPPVN